MSALAQQPPPVDAAEIFNNAVRAIFSRWTLLRLAVDQGWADGDEATKADALVTRILEMVAPSVRRVPDESEIADVLHDSIEGTFNAQAEDGSVEEISRTILRLRAECSAGNVATATTYIQQAASDLSSSVGREDEAGEAEEVVVAPAPAPLPPHPQAACPPTAAPAPAAIARAPWQRYARALLAPRTVKNVLADPGAVASRAAAGDAPPAGSCRAALRGKSSNRKAGFSTTEHLLSSTLNSYTVVCSL